MLVASSAPSAETPDAPSPVEEAEAPTCVQAHHAQPARDNSGPADCGHEDAGRLSCEALEALESVRAEIGEREMLDEW